MSETKFTPGPWSVEESWYDGPLYYVNDRDGTSIAGVSMERTKGIDQALEMDKANAHLIAAAPDLYAALEKALSAAEDWIHSELSGTSLLQGELDALAPCYAALKKARGEQ